MRLGGKLVAMTETPMTYILDDSTLSTLGRSDAWARYERMEIVRMTTGHPIWHERLQKYVNYSVHVTPFGCTYNVLLVPAELPGAGASSAAAAAKEGKGSRTELQQWSDAMAAASTVYSMPIKSPAYMHSFTVTDKYIILTESPMRFSFSAAAMMQMNGSLATDVYKWTGENGYGATSKDSSREGKPVNKKGDPVQFRIISLDTGKEVACIPAPPPCFFTLHHLNAYETTVPRAAAAGVGAAGTSTAPSAAATPSSSPADDAIFIDICCYDSPRVIKDMYLEKLRKRQPGAYGGFLRRFIINLSSKTCTEAERPAATTAAADACSAAGGAGTGQVTAPAAVAAAPAAGSTTGPTRGGGAATGDARGDCSPVQHQKDPLLQQPSPVSSYSPLCEALARACVSFDLPRINESYTGRHYTFSYAMEASLYSDAVALVKINVETGETVRWQDADVSPGEPVFVPRPKGEKGSCSAAGSAAGTGTAATGEAAGAVSAAPETAAEPEPAEDDGILLSVCLRLSTGKSFLAVVDARTMALLAEVQTSVHTPLSYHGNYYSRAEMMGQSCVPQKAL